MAKEKLKTEPRGVRLDLKKLAFVQEREGLPTVQKVVDFLLDAYWWAAKAGKKPRRKKVAPKKEEPRDLSISAGVEIHRPGIPPVPVREQFEDNWRYLEAKALWKDKYGR